MVKEAGIGSIPYMDCGTRGGEKAHGPKSPMLWESD